MTSSAENALASATVPFGPMGDRARIWHPLVILIGGFVAFYFWATLPTIVLASMDAAAGRTTPGAPGSLMVDYGFAALGISFSLILVHFLLWTRFGERRPLTSIGMFRGGAAPKYLNGIIYGALFAVLINLGGDLAARLAGFATPDMFAKMIAFPRPDLLLFAMIIVPVILVQGGTEEVVFRGWMLSALSARTSITLAVIVSGIAFGLFHADRFVIDPTFALIFIAGTVVLGCFLAVWATRSGSIAGPAGFHGAYNGLMFVYGFLDTASSGKPGETGAQIWGRMMSLEAMQAEIRFMDYNAVVQTIVVISSLVAIAFMLLSRPAETNANEG